MHEYINLTAENIDNEHICCAIGDPKHQCGVDKKKERIKNKLKDGHVFRKLNDRGKIFIEYEPIETARVPVIGQNYEYIYCLWVAGSFKGKGIGKELLEYAINDAKEKKMSGVCTLVSKKKKPFLGEKKFFEHFGFKVVDSIADYELLALEFNKSETPKFNDSARKMKIDSQDFTIYYTNECPYVEYEVQELSDYAKEKKINLNFIKIDSLEKAKNAPCIFNNWANFYKGEFISNTILNANALEKLLKQFYSLIITKMTIYDYEITKRDGSSIKMEEFKGKVLIIVNTATGCGFTPQYEGLENLYKKYHEKGLEILDFPCDQFGHQAPGNDDEIHQFCTMKYNTTFDQFSKIEVNGENESPLFTYLKQQKTDDEIKGLKNKTIMMGVKNISSTCKNKGDIIWNFTKFLVDKDGNIVNRYSPTYVPGDMEEEIQRLLG